MSVPCAAHPCLFVAFTLTTQQHQQQQQLQALQAQLQQEQVARAAADSKAELLRSKLKEVGERSKARGNQLAALAAAARRLVEAKQQLAEAEGHLQGALAGAEAFLQVGALIRMARNGV